MVFGYRIGCVVDQGNALFDVPADFLINLFERPALVLGIKIGFGMIHIRYAQIILRRFGVIGHTEHVGQYEVRIGPAQQRFALAGLERCRDGTAHILDSRECLICIGDVAVVGAPDVPRGIIVAGYIFRPFINILIELVVIFCDTSVADVVRRQFSDELITARSAHISRNENIGDFFLGIQRRAQVGILIQKIAARHQCRDDDRGTQ